MTNEIASDRDVRIDLIRGFALLILFSDHVRGNIIAEYTPVSFGLSDMSDVFIFLSGYSCGISYGRRLATNGLLDCVNHTWMRAGQLFCFKILITALSLVLFCFVERWSSPIFLGIPWDLQLTRQRPIETFLEIEAFRLELFPYFILSLYIPLLIMFPAFLLGMKYHPKLTFFAMAFVYILTQLFPNQMALAEPWRGAMCFNILAWQFLFFTAASLALKRGETFTLLRSKFSIFAGALFVFVLVVAWRDDLKLWDQHLVEKRNLGILRLIHFTAIVIVGRWVTPNSRILSQMPILNPLITCGRYPLVGYSIGGIAGILGEVAFNAISNNWQMQLLVNLTGWSICIGTTMLWGMKLRPSTYRFAASN